MSTSLRRLPGVGQLCPQPSPNPTGSAWCPEMSPNCWPTLNVPKCPEIGGALFLTANEYTAQSAMRDCCKLTRNSRRHGIAPHWPVLLYSLRWPEDNVAPQSMCVSPLEVLALSNFVFFRLRFVFFRLPTANIRVGRYLRTLDGFEDIWGQCLM